jgi:hypothetical protein
MVLLLNKWYPVNQIKKCETEGTCGLYGRELYVWSCCGNLRKRDHFVNLGVIGKMILEWIFKK